MPGGTVYPTSDDGNVTKFIRDTFKKRECNRFRKEKIEHDTEFCECGYAKEVHSDEAIQNESELSQPTTKTRPTDAFGKLYFDQDDDRKIKRYIRLDSKTDAKNILQLFEYWKMDRPHVIISVVSDSDRSTDDEKNKTAEQAENIKKVIPSLVDLAASTNAWIITGGLNNGVEKLIGNELKRRLANKDKIPEAVLGISNWGCLKEKLALVNKSHVSKGNESDSEQNESSLNPHHTHFLLVDDGTQKLPGTQKKAGCECNLRRMVELALRNWKRKGRKEELDIPVIYILIGGSHNALGFVERALANQIPVIIVEGTGGAADAISDITSRKTTSKDDPTLDETNLKVIERHNQKKLMIRFNIATEVKYDISNSIVEALKQANLDKPCDVYMLFAGLDNEHFFGQLLHQKWAQHYHEYVFMKLVDQGSSKYVRLMMKRADVSSWLTGGQIYLEKEFQENELCAPLMTKINDKKSKEYSEDELPRMKAKMAFIWCIQKKMPEASMFLWKQAHDCLALSLSAYHILKKQRNDSRHKEGCEKIDQHMQFFSKLAIDLLRTCYADNRQHTHDLLVGKVKDLNDRTPLQIAVEANFKAFVSESPVQQLLDKIWIKNIEKHDKYRCVPILIPVACPVLAPVLLDFKTPEDDDREEKHKNNTSEKSDFVGSYFWKLKEFFKAPNVKFLYGFISYIGYLILFSIVMLTDFRTKISPSEIALTIWTFILIIEEVRQAIVQKRDYKNVWNYFDIVAMVTYIIGFTLRMIYDGAYWICPDCLYVARIILAFSLMIFFFRSLQFPAIIDSIGHKIHMLRGLISDLVGFMLILMVFVSAYGVVSNVILYPNQPLNGKLLQDVFYDAWWSVMQQFNREDALGLNCNPNTYITAEYCASTSIDNIDYVSCKANGCPANNWIVSVLLAFYALLTIILLLNVLIAMFFTTFSTIHEKQKEVSKMQRYRLIREYSARSMVPPPLCVITYPYHIVRYLIKLCSDWFEDEDQSQQGSGNQHSSQGEEKEKGYNDKDYSNHKDEKSVKGSGKSKSPYKPFEKELTLEVNNWELQVAEDFYKQNKDKDGWLLARLESEKNKSGVTSEFPISLDEMQMIKFIIQQSCITIREKQSSGEIDWSEWRQPNNDETQEKKKKKKKEKREKKRKESEQASDSKA